MHHALEIQEILSNIFDHRLSPYRRVTADLAALARTCRAFKEPALDLLWRELNDLSPLVLCLPGASCTRRINDKVRYIQRTSIDSGFLL